MDALEQQPTGDSSEDGAAQRLDHASGFTCDFAVALIVLGIATFGLIAGWTDPTAWGTAGIATVPCALILKAIILIAAARRLRRGSARAALVVLVVAGLAVAGQSAFIALGISSARHSEAGVVLLTLSGIAVLLGGVCLIAVSRAMPAVRVYRSEQGFDRGFMPINVSDRGQGNDRSD